MIEEHPATPAEPQPATCQKCGSTEPEEGHSCPLCRRCREELVRRPVPFWVKAFMGLVAIAMAFALKQFPGNITAAAHFERGRRAEAENRYLTAIREYKAAAKEYPDSTLVLARLYMAYFHNWQINEAFATFLGISGRKVSDDKLVAEVNQVTERIDALFGTVGELNEAEKRCKDDPEAFLNELRTHLVKKPGDILWAGYLVDKLFDRKEFDEADRVMTAALQANKDYGPGLLSLAGICREKGQYERGLEYCREALKLNMESPDAYTAMARIELKRGRDAEGLAQAKRAYALDRNYPRALATLALAWHYNGNPAERDKYFALFKKHKERDDYNLKLLTGIFSGEEEWREPPAVPAASADVVESAKG